MESNKRLIHKAYDESQIDNLQEFCKRCESLGYKNNSSLETMRLKYALDHQGQFFLTYYNQQIISLSGFHKLDEVGDNVYRILFRGVTLDSFQNHLGLTSKTHMNSIPFYYHIPMVLNNFNEHGDKKFVITTNWKNSEIPSMNKSHRVFQLLEKQGIVSNFINHINLFNTDQTVWLLNTKIYLKLRQEYQIRNKLND